MTFARGLLRLYPRRWRERYESEVMALIEDSGLSLTDALDLVGGATREWVRLDSSRLGRFIVEGVCLPYEKRIAPGYQRYYLGAVAARILIASVVYPISRPVARALEALDQFSWTDPLLTSIVLITGIGLWRMSFVRPAKIDRVEDEKELRENLERYPLPRINRWLTMRTRGLYFKPGPTRSVTVSIPQGITWIALSIITVAYLGTDSWSTGWQRFFIMLENSVFASMLITSSIAAMIRRSAQRRPSQDPAPSV